MAYRHCVLPKLLQKPKQDLLNHILTRISQLDFTRLPCNPLNSPNYG
ncbi:hypothetical protein NTHI1209_00257 [Haemophilus influenzae]|uniref:Uncharacterized protein n=1 Tax=Haemophilus influenzae TaxID=727 RepID=A0A158SUW1_HAEIF|nr:hypothetical protein NTHI1209_00257 [Haemophilus influenzae]